MWKFLMRHTGKIALATGGAALLAFGVSNLPVVLLSAAAFRGVYIATAALTGASVVFGSIYLGQNNHTDSPQLALAEEPLAASVLIQINELVAANRQKFATIDSKQNENKHELHRLVREVSLGNEQQAEDLQATERAMLAMSQRMDRLEAANRNRIFSEPVSAVGTAPAAAAEGANQESMGIDQLPQIRRRGNPHGSLFR